MKLKTSLKIGAAGMLAAAGFLKEFFKPLTASGFAFDKVNDFVYSFARISLK